jgi:uncharacterized protein (TIGR00290 family)
MESTEHVAAPEMLLGTGALEKLKGKRCLASWSGGKDSCLALYRAVRHGAQVETLVNMQIESGERSRSHGLRSAVIAAQADAMGMKLRTAAATWEDYEEAFVRMLQEASAEGLEAAIFGDIEGQAHLEWERMVCSRADLLPVLPVWQADRAALVAEFLEAGFETRLVMVRAEALSPDYLGRKLSLELAEEFEPQGVDACGENGEFHTVVTDGPLFKHPLTLRPGEQVLRDGCWFLDFELSEISE